MSEKDIAYFRRRDGEERQRAAACVDPAVAQIHRQLADQYAAALAASVDGRARTAPASALL